MGLCLVNIDDGRHSAPMVTKSSTKATTHPAGSAIRARHGPFRSTQKERLDGRQGASRAVLNEAQGGGKSLYSNEL